MESLADVTEIKRRPGTKMHSRLLKLEICGVEYRSITGNRNMVIAEKDGKARTFKSEKNIQNGVEFRREIIRQVGLETLKYDILNALITNISKPTILVTQLEENLDEYVLEILATYRTIVIRERYLEIIGADGKNIFVSLENDSYGMIINKNRIGYDNKPSSNEYILEEQRRARLE